MEQGTARPSSGWADLLVRWTLHLVAANRTPQTIETRIEHLRRIAREFPAGPDSLTPDAWERWSGQQRWATETRRSYTASVRSFYAWHNHSDPTATVPAIRPAEPNPRPIPDPLLLRAIASAPPRTRLILRLAAEAGLRRAEVSTVHADDITPGSPPTLLVHGKGRKTRTVPLPADLAELLIEATRPHGWAFPGPAGHITPRHVSALASRVLPAGWTLHSLRHRFAARAYTDRDILAVQRLLGHTSPATTQRYVPTPLDALTAAATHAYLSTSVDGRSRLELVPAVPRAAGAAEAGGPQRPPRQPPG